MENIDINKIMDRFENSSISELEITYKDFQIKCKKNISSNNSQTNFNKIEPNEKNEKSKSEEKQVENNIKIIKSPIVGTFYRAPSPDSHVYVEIDQIVEKGQPLCIIEAMKMMNELESEFKCKIKEILVNSGQLVEFDQPLFKVEVL